MVKYCPKCGAESSEETKFCVKCGANIEIIASTPKYQQTYQPMSHSIGLNKKIIALVAVVVIIVVVAVLLLLLIGGNNNSFVGKWRVQNVDSGIEIIWTVNSDGTVIAEYNGEKVDEGHWEQKGDTICGYWESNPDDNRCINVEFSNGGNTLKLYNQGELEYIATRIG